MKQEQEQKLVKKAEKFDLLNKNHLKKDISDLQDKQREAYKKLMKGTAERPLKKRYAFRLLKNIYSDDRNARKNFKMFLVNENFKLKLSEGGFVENVA